MMRKLIWIPIILLMLLTGGCTEMAARWVTEANYLQVAAFSYVHEVHDLRRWIRGLCKESLQRSVVKALQAAETEEGEEALRKLLADHYPGLVTMDALKAAREDTANVLSRAPGCE